MRAVRAALGGGVMLERYRRPAVKTYDLSAPARLGPGKRTSLPGAVVKWVLDVVRHKCQKCGRDLKDCAEIHHIQAVCEGGTDHPDNLCALCDWCHTEWTLCELDDGSFFGVPFVEWLQLPPAPFMASLLAKQWPFNVSAAEFQTSLLTLMRERKA